MSGQEQHLDPSPGAPIEAQRSGFGGERRDSGADELLPQAEASERSSLTGPPSKPSEAVSMGRGEARERAELPPQGEAEQSGLCLDDVSRETSETQEKAPPPPQKNSPSSFYRYLLVLFGAAFLMLLLAYFVQQRNNDAAQEDLQLLTASRQELLEDIKTLEGEKEGLKGRIAELEEQLEQERGYSQKFQALYDGARNSISHLEYYLNKRSEAMELFWQLDRAYTQGKNQQCRELMELMDAPETEPLKNYLPGSQDRKSYNNIGYADNWLSPAERYEEIHDKLIKQ